MVGAGTQGLLQIQAAHARGVEVVWVREPRPERLALAEAAGAERHGNEPVDVAIVCTPNAGAIAAAADALAPGGALCLYAPPPRAPARARRREPLLPRVGRDASYSAGPHDVRAALELLASGRIDPAALVSHRVGLDGAGRALEMTRSGEALKAVVVLRAALLYGPGTCACRRSPTPRARSWCASSAATTCGTDVKMFHRGHPVLPAYPCPFGHETAGTRADTGDRVLVSDSVACGRCAPCRDARPQICRAPRWVLGAFAERIAAPAAALHAIPDGLEPAGAAMAEPLAAAVHAVARGGEAGDAGVLGGGPMGLMLARLLALAGRDVTVADRHPERRAQAEALGARAVRDPRAPRAGVRGGRPARGMAGGGGGRGARCQGRPRRRLRRGAEVPSPPTRCTTTSSTYAAASTTARPRSTRRLRCWPPAMWTGTPSPAR